MWFPPANIAGDHLPHLFDCIGLLIGLGLLDGGCPIKAGEDGMKLVFYERLPPQHSKKGVDVALFVDVKIYLQ
jgi:hypothetical protein